MENLNQKLYKYILTCIACSFVRDEHWMLWKHFQTKNKTKKKYICSLQKVSVGVKIKLALNVCSVVCTYVQCTWSSKLDPHLDKLDLFPIFLFCFLHLQCIYFENALFQFTEMYIELLGCWHSVSHTVLIINHFENGQKYVTSGKMLGFPTIDYIFRLRRCGQIQFTSLMAKIYTHYTFKSNIFIRPWKINVL